MNIDYVETTAKGTLFNTLFQYWLSSSWH